MTNEREALKLALEALEGADMIDCDMRDAITAIKEALMSGTDGAQPEQEPVVWMYQDKSTHEVRFQKHMRDFVDHGQTYETPLYTSPPQRKPPKAGDGSALFYEAVRLLDNAIFAQSGDVIRHDSAAHREAVDFFNQVFTRLDSPPPPQRPSRSDIKPLTKIIPMAQPAVTESHKQESVETLDHKAIGKQAYESGYSTGYMDCAVKMQAKKEQEPVTDNTYGYAKSLAEAIFKQHFSSDEHYASGRIVWDVNDTVIGILTQIDNMVAGMVRKPEQEPINDSGINLDDAVKVPTLTHGVLVSLTDAELCIKTLKRKIHELVGELIGYKKIVADQDALLLRNAERIIDLQTHIANLEGEE